MPTPNDNSQEKSANTSFKRQKPNYKRFDLTITIPDSPDVKKTVRIDPAGNFLESYFKEQCFPIGLGFEKKSYSGYARSTVWNVVFSVESIFMLFLLDSDIDIEGYAKAAVIPGLVCLASLPVSAIITPLLRRSDSRLTILIRLFGYLFSLFIIGLCFYCSFFFEVEDNLLIATWSVLLGLELIIAEPLRTIIKSAVYLWFIEQGVCSKFCYEL
eukprot:CAMPEP_0202428322 /NCGR_PEP_ID=MMETSP1345-20130828/2357_1 /ASSEMBLY_ACC=CAM_ASM_000843 /TAXON_ID=342563 /ORGANISM="Fabrea Fabrea salina" /LENGTH=213 /DNA_ID=CAMNT_0049039277 /DNA_START=113 /DNA_END=754 /DNA_ORIENTATION=-